MTFYKDIIEAINHKKKLLAILIDPEKIVLEKIYAFTKMINESPATHIFIGGSTYSGNALHLIISELKKNCNLPVILFPGDYKQIATNADAILFLSLLSGRNPDFLIDHQIKSVPFLEKTNLEIIPTSYLLIESGTKTAVERVSQTQPLKTSDYQLIYQTAKAGEYLGQKMIYLEAGSGAAKSVPNELISYLKSKINIPIIVGGGIKSLEDIKNKYEFGADMVVIGTAFENDPNFFNS